MVVGLFEVTLLARVCRGVVRRIFLWSRLFSINIVSSTGILSTCEDLVERGIARYICARDIFIIIKWKLSFLQTYY